MSSAPTTQPTDSARPSYDRGSTAARLPNREALVECAAGRQWT